MIIIFFCDRPNQSIGNNTLVIRANLPRTTRDLDCRERESHARCVSHKQDNSRIGTAREKQNENSDTRMITKKE